MLHLLINLIEKIKIKNRLKLITYKGATHFDVYNSLCDETILQEIKFLKEEFNLV